MSKCFYFQMVFEAYTEQAMETQIQTVNVTDCMDYITVNTLKNQVISANKAFGFSSFSIISFLLSSLADSKYNQMVFRDGGKTTAEPVAAKVIADLLLTHNYQFEPV